MASTDPRKESFVQTANAYLGAALSADRLSSEQSTALNKFLDSDAMLLVATQLDGAVHLGDQVVAVPRGTSRVAFYKSAPQPVAVDNYARLVMVANLTGGALTSLYHLVHVVYNPALVQSSAASDPKLHDLLSELEHGLHQRIRRSDGASKHKTDPAAELAVAGILCPEDEHAHWRDASGSGASKERERAQRFAQLLELTATEMSQKASCSMLAFGDVLDRAHEAYDELWRQDDHESYPEKRMRNLLEVTGNSVVQFIQSKLAENALWSGDAAASDGLNRGIALCEQWDASVSTLTGQLWRRLPTNTWSGEQLKPDYLINFRKRLEEIVGVQTVMGQLAAMGGDEAALTQMQTAAADAFGGVDPVFYNPYTESEWQSRLDRFERAIRPTVQRALPPLRALFHASDGASSETVFWQLEKFKNVLRRPLIQKELVSERETALSQMLDAVKGIRENYNQRINRGDIPLAKHTPEIVSTIVWVRQQEARVEQMAKVARLLLADLSQWPRLESDAAALVEEMSVVRRERFDAWCRDLIQAIDDPSDSIGLETTGKLMSQHHKRGSLQVNFSDRLVRMLREVRQLSSLGYLVPVKIQQCANTAQKFYRHAIILKQVAHFYNTIEQQMLPCQQAMMLDAALAFEQLVKDEAGGDQLSWNNPTELEAYIQKLQAAAARLMTQNRRLRTSHSIIAEKVAKLMNLDLIKQQQQWKDTLAEIREIIKQAETQGINPSNMVPWKAHWDRQLYKALEHQYQLGIESLHQQVPEIRVDLVFKQQKLQLRPPIEEIRAKYFRELKKFLSIPYKFKGVHDMLAENSIFVVMAQRNANRFDAVYRKAEELFQRISAVEHQFKDWVTLGQIDLESLIEDNFKSAADWEAALKMIKTKGRDAEKLPSEVRLGCVHLSTAPVKAAIDDQLQRLFDALLSTLRRSIAAETQQTAAFLADATGALSTRPQSVDEVAAANVQHTQLGARKAELRPLLSEAEEKNKLLRSVAGGGVETMAQLQQQWDKFELMLDSHQLMIKEQVDVLKQNVDSRVAAFKQAAEKFAARWHQLKPNDEQLEADRNAVVQAVDFIKERRLQFNDLEQQQTQLQQEMQQFDMEVQHFPIMDETNADLKLFEGNWLLYEEFNAGLAELAKEDWIAFRSKTYLFEEFLAAWTERLKTVGSSQTTLRLRKEVDKLRDVAPALKYCRGEMLSTDHWLELFRLVGLPRGTTIEALTFGDLVSVADAILSGADALKELNARAQGEVTIREAIRELELWGVSTVFSLVEYKDSGQLPVQVIKDWKEVVNQVGDNQSLLQSLKDSPYFAQFADKAGIWETKLADLDEYLHSLNHIQRKWVYLEPIFGRGALPAEQARFRRVDQEFRAILSDVVADARVVSLCNRSGMRTTLQQLLDQLSRCQKALNEFLEEKRRAFPRFYFLGDDDLLEILGQSTNPTVIQSHLKKLFQGIHSVHFGDNDKHIVAMVSLEGEIVSFKRPVNIVPEVEIWLQQLSEEMKASLKDLLVQCVQSADQGVDPGKFPSQVLCLSEQIRFTEQCENAITSGTLAQLLNDLRDQLEAYTGAQPSSKVLVLKLKALILELIHSIEVVERLIEAAVVATDQWLWQKQLRVYLRKSDQTAVMKMVDASFDYTYEYQGNAPKLVHTPLTDKCYLTLTQAMLMGLGGNPYGPAGTGKTESVKALGGLFGRQVLVFNCDEGIDVRSIGRIFTGLVKCGAWGCFDEFNRLDEAVLSAVSMQIQTIQDCLRSRSPYCELLGAQVFSSAQRLYV